MSRGHRGAANAPRLPLCSPTHLRLVCVLRPIKGRVVAALSRSQRLDSAKLAAHLRTMLDRSHQPKETNSHHAHFPVAPPARAVKTGRTGGPNQTRPQVIHAHGSGCSGVQVFICCCCLMWQQTEYSFRCYHREYKHGLVILLIRNQIKNCYIKKRISW